MILRFKRSLQLYSPRSKLCNNNNKYYVIIIIIIHDRSVGIVMRLIRIPARDKIFLSAKFSRLLRGHTECPIQCLPIVCCFLRICIYRDKPFYTFTLILSTVCVCAVPNMPVFCSSLISFLPHVFLRYCLKNLEMIRFVCY